MLPLAPSAPRSPVPCAARPPRCQAGFDGPPQGRRRQAQVRHRDGASRGLGPPLLPPAPCSWVHPAGVRIRQSARGLTSSSGRRPRCRAAERRPAEAMPRLASWATSPGRISAAAPGVHARALSGGGTAACPWGPDGASAAKFAALPVRALRATRTSARNRRAPRNWSGCDRPGAEPWPPAGTSSP